MANYQYPGQAFTRDLKPLKGWYNESGIDAAGVLTANVNIGGVGTPAQRGQIVHIAGVQTLVEAYGGLTTGPQLFNFEMGCATAQGPPLWLWTPPTDPDAYNPGVPTGVPVYGTTNYPPDFAPVLPNIEGGNLVALVGTAALEVETTEFDTNVALTYAPGQPLRAVNSNTDAAAGQITNQRATSVGFNTAGLVQWVGTIATPANWDTIVGWVSRGKYVNSNRRPVLALFTDYLPGNR